MIASGSKYFVEVFRAYPDLKTVAVPHAYIQAYEENSDDQVIRILKYFYANQVRIILNSDTLLCIGL